MQENPQKNNEFSISWAAPEFVRYEKSQGWFIALAIIGLALIAVALLTQNYLFALIIIMATFLIYIQAKKHPRKINFAISDKGVDVDGKRYFHNELKSFWIFEDSAPPILSILTKKIIQPHLEIILGSQEPEKIKKILIKFLPEKKQEETFSDIIVRRIRF